MQRAIILKIPFKKHDHSVNIVCNLNSSSAIYCACFSILLNILLLHVLRKDATPWYHYLYIYLFNNMYIKPLIYILEGVCVCVYACYELPCACIFCLYGFLRINVLSGISGEENISTRRLLLSWADCPWNSGTNLYSHQQCTKAQQVLPFAVVFCISFLGLPQ